MLGLTKPQPFMSLNPEKVKFARKTQYFYSFDDTMSWCQFIWGPAWHVYGPEHSVAMIRAVSGWTDFDVEDLLTMGERRINLMRAFNAREELTTTGYGAGKLSPRAGRWRPSDGVKINRKQLQAAIVEYYKQAGWNAETGNPERPTYERLGLGWVADELGL